jgi:3-phosphoshikimate 1-carboxyvinyltransferase
MNQFITLKCKETHVEGAIELPISKSESNRALMIAAYRGSDPNSLTLSDADDTQRLQQNLSLISNCHSSGIPAVIDCNNAGTVYRFLLTYLAGLSGKWMLIGNYRMKERPIADLVNSLRQLGAQIHYPEKEGYPPVLIHGKPLLGGKVSLRMNLSSQFASSLLMAAPTWPKGLLLEMGQPVKSRPYLDMTLKMMQHFGIKANLQPNRISVGPQSYKKRRLELAADWSSAAFWYELLALCKSGTLILKGLKQDSLQGDSISVEIFEKLGIVSHFDRNGLTISKNDKISDRLSVDFRDCPDLLPSVAATSCGMGIKAKFTGISNLKHKESDRTLALITELRKIGCRFVQPDVDTLLLEAPKSLVQSTPIFKTYGDHRLAMAFAPLALKTGAAVVYEPDVVSKSYPSFWQQLKQLDLFDFSF